MRYNFLFFLVSVLHAGLTWEDIGHVLTPNGSLYNDLVHPFSGSSSRIMPLIKPLNRVALVCRDMGE
jgi:hypothetical protein